MSNPIWKYKSNIILGILVAVIPFLGLPSVFKTFLFVILGLLIAVLSYAAERNIEEGIEGDTFKNINPEPANNSGVTDHGTTNES